MFLCVSVEMHSPSQTLSFIRQTLSHLQHSHSFTHTLPPHTHTQESRLMNVNTFTFSHSLHITIQVSKQKVVYCVSFSGAYLLDCVYPPTHNTIRSHFASFYHQPHVYLSVYDLALTCYFSCFSCPEQTNRDCKTGKYRCKASKSLVVVCISFACLLFCRPGQGQMPLYTRMTYSWYGV